MKKLLLIVSMMLSAILMSFGQSWPWVVSEGGSGTDEYEHIAVDSDGNILVAGKFSSSLQIGSTMLSSAGEKDVLLAKYSPNGTLLWAVSGGGQQTDEGLSVCTDPNNNVFVTGFFKGQADFGSTTIYGMDVEDIFIAKYNQSGTLQWVKYAMGPGDDRGKGIACDDIGDVYVTGYFKDSCYFENNWLVSQGVDDVFLAKYDASGNFLWVLDAGSADQAWASTVGVNSLGEAWITGSYEGTAYFGSNSITSTGGNDVFLAKASYNGNWVLAVSAGGVDDDFGNGLFVDDMDHIAITGSFFQTVSFPPAASITSNGSKDGFIAYYNPAGNCNWVHNFGGTGQDKGIDVAVDEQSNVYVTGFVNGVATFNTITQTSSGGDDIFIAKYDITGQIGYATLAGGTSNDYGKGMGVGDPGEVFVAGYYQGSATFGTSTVTSNGDREAYLARFDDESPEITEHPADTLTCSGETISLSVSASGAMPMSYQWFDQAGSIMGASNSTYTFTPTDPTWSGNYYCVVSNSSGSTTSDPAYVGVYDDPEPDLGPDQSITQTESISLDPGSIYYSYVWNTGATSQIIIVDGSTLSIGTHVYSVTVTNIAGCEGSDEINVTVYIDGIEELRDIYGLELYPIPATDILYLNSGKFEAISYKLLDMAGRVVMADDIRRKDHCPIHVSGLEHGTYFLMLRNRAGIEVGVKVSH